MKQKIIRFNLARSSKILLVLSLLVCGCNSTKKRSSYYSSEIERYKNEIKSYDCKKLNSEILFINSHLKSLDKQTENSSFDSFMEGFLSAGFYSSSGISSLKQNKDFFEKKQKIINNNQKSKFCHDQKN